MTRRICYITGTRADFGLMQASLAAIQSHPKLSLEILVTGMHLSPAYGSTVKEIRSFALPIRAEIPVSLEPATGMTMARNIGHLILAFLDELGSDRPDVIMLLGDRGEMLAAAIAAIHLNLPIVHIHGGERSGTVDEPIRHAISKLSHCHFVATEDSRQRLIRMGERDKFIWVVGAPGLEGLDRLANTSRAVLCRDAGLDANRPVALMLFHPVLQEQEQAEESTCIILDSLQEQQIQVIALMPNSDAGSDPVRAVLRDRDGKHGVRVLTHLKRDHFASWMAACDLMIGNSSAGIIEAATFGTPVINVGNRQKLRERNCNTIDVQLERQELSQAIWTVLNKGRMSSVNVYGDGNTSQRIIDLLLDIDFTSELLLKSNAY